MTNPTPAVQVQKDEALAERDEARTIYYNAIADANQAQDALAEAEQLGSPTRIAAAHERCEAAEKAVDVAFRAFKSCI